MSQTCIGAQLYTVRDFTKTASDFAATCKKLREIGYRSVQISALGPIDDAEVAKILDGEGIICPVTHVSFDKIKDTEGCLSYHKTFNCDLTALGHYRSDKLADWKQFISEFGEAARRLAAKGFRVGYHNHSHEWALIDGVRPIDLMIETFGEEVWFEIDTYWVAHAGGDPAAWIERIGQLKGDRIPVIHVKDMHISLDRQHKMCEVGSGNLNWPAILKACRAAGVKWYMVERDSGDLDPFESLKISYNNLREMGLE
ncbi:MAG: sugar phosphate isomerase/epimerase [Phycisphaeraceae bacterium]|nr:sugar phosphate isomerase/epimerase [Phycisphaeraceae bacterium]